MRTILYLLFISIILSSCSSTYFYSTLNSADKNMEKVDNGDFLIENDSLWIAYCFNGKNAPIQITVFNKSKSPLYINWQESALIIDNTALSYTGSRIDNIYNQYGEYIGNIETNASTNNHVTFVPPGTMVSKKPINIMGINYENIPDKDYTKMTMLDENGEIIRIKKIDFYPSTSPLKFKSYLTLYTTDKNKPMVFEQEFFLSNIIKSKGLTPKTMDKILVERGDLFYIQKEPNTTALEILLGTTLVVGAVAIDVMVNTNETY